MTRMLAVVLVVSSVAAAQPASPDVAQRFERALRLYAQGNKELALAEFQKLWAESRKPAALFNIALVQAALGHPVEAIEAADQLLANPGSFAPARLQKLRELRESQLDKVGQLTVTAPQGVDVSISGRKLGTSPLDKPVLVPTGRVVVAGEASRRKPGFVETTVPPRGRVDVVLELAPLEAQLGAVRLNTRTPGADVFVDGVKVGQTPTLTRIPVEPGQRVIELRRDGYESVKQSLDVGEAAELQVSLEPKPDAQALELDGATVTAKTSETQVVLTVDGQRRGLLAGSFKLAPGPHVLQFERGGFYPVKRELTVAAQEVVTVEVEFEPTPDLRAELERSLFWHRLLGIGGLSLGAVLAGGSAGYLAWNADTRRVWEGRQALYVSQQSTGCPDESGMGRDCNALIAQAEEQVRQTRQLDVLGYVGVGVGALFAIGGTVSLLTAPSLSKYDAAPAQTELMQLSLAPFGTGLQLLGRF